MKSEGNAVVYCDKAFATTYGKTAHGLVRFTERYRVVAVLDSSIAGEPDAGEFLDRRKKGIPIVKDLERARELASSQKLELTHYIIGVATDGGYLTDEIIDSVEEALQLGLNVDSGLHDFLADRQDLKKLAEEKNLQIRDIRKTSRESNHMFSGKIGDVSCAKVAVLGTDSALGKRTTAWMIVHELQKRSRTAELIGTGQTAWLQGAKYSTVMDSLVNDYVSGELEHLVWSAWKEEHMDFAVIEGQGSLMNPGYPGGFEILAACRPDGIIMQHAPGRTEYDGFPGYPLDSLKDQIFLVEFLSKKPVIAISINHEGLSDPDVDWICDNLQKEFKLPVVDPLLHGPERLADAVEKLRK